MTYHIYLDVYFFMNLGMNLMILWAEKQLLQLPAKTYRLAISGSIGAVFSCLVIFLPQYLFRWYGIFAILVLGPVMVFIAFGSGSYRLFLKKLAGFYLVTVVMAGTIEVLQRFWPAAVTGNRLYAILGWFFLGAAAVWLVRGLMSLFMDWKRKRKYLYQVVIHYRGRQKQVTALWDSGNRLREPYTQKAVHVITYDVCKSICKTAAGVLYIPFASIGAGEGMLPAIYMDEMEIFQEGKLVTKLERPLVAITRRTLSSDGEYDMLLNEELEGENRGGRGDDC